MAHATAEDSYVATTPTGSFDQARPSNHLKIGEVANLLEGAADPTISYAAAGTSNWFDIGKYVAGSLLFNITAGVSLTSIQFRIDWSNDGSTVYLAQNVAISAGTATLTDQEFTKAMTADGLFIYNFEKIARYMRIRAKRTDGSAATRIQVDAEFISHKS